MKPQIVNAPSRKFVGMSEDMSLRDDKTVALFRRAMPHVKNVPNRINPDVFDIQFFSPRFNYETFSMVTEFTKWAAVEVDSLKIIPDPLLGLDLVAGKYAVFVHQGPADTFPTTLAQIYNEWLPVSGYQVDARAHLGVMPPGYLYDDPKSEEEIWIPIV